MNTRQMREKLTQIRCFVLDMDGTIYLGDELFPFTNAFLRTVTEVGKTYCFFTNNSSKNAAAYLDKLARMGVPVTPEQMHVSTHVLLRHLQQNYPGCRAYVLGTPLLLADFEAAGIPLEEQSPDVVVLGFDTTLTYDKLCRACDFVRAGLPYFGVNPDLNCPVENGGFMPDCGSIARLIEASTGVLPEFFGKPSRRTLDYIADVTGLPLAQIAVVGDRLYTDIALTYETEATSILVLTGEATAEEAAVSSTPPDMIVPSLAELTALLRG